VKIEVGKLVAGGDAVAEFGQIGAADANQARRRAAVVARHSAGGDSDEEGGGFG